MRMVFLLYGCAPTSRFVTFFGNSRVWRTARGLRIGDPTAHVKKVYPNAKAVQHGPIVHWTLLQRHGSKVPNVVAWTQNGKVTALSVHSAHAGFGVTRWS